MTASGWLRFFSICRFRAGPGIGPMVTLRNIPNPT